MEDKINLMEYGYAPEQEVTINIKGHQILGLMQLLNYVVEENRIEGFYLNGYQSEAVPMYFEMEDGNKVLDSVEVKWEPYTNPNSFFSQVPTSGITELGARAMDLLFPLKNIHKQLIDQGVAKLQE